MAFPGDRAGSGQGCHQRCGAVTGVSQVLACPCHHQYHPEDPLLSHRDFGGFSCHSKPKFCCHRGVFLGIPLDEGEEGEPCSRIDPLGPEREKLPGGRVTSSPYSSSTSSSSSSYTSSSSSSPPPPPPRAFHMLPSKDAFTGAARSESRSSPLQAIKGKLFLLNQAYLNMEMIFNYSESISFYHRNVFERGSPVFAGLSNKRNANSP